MYKCTDDKDWSVSAMHLHFRHGSKPKSLKELVNCICTFLCGLFGLVGRLPRWIFYVRDQTIDISQELILRAN